MGERTEVFMRLFVGIVSGIIFTVWRWLIIVFVIMECWDVQKWDVVSSRMNKLM